MNSYAWWPTLIVLIVATFTDLRSRRIPNWLVLPFMAAGLVVPGCSDWVARVRPERGRFWAALIYGILSIVGAWAWGCFVDGRDRSLGWPQAAFIRDCADRHGRRVDGAGEGQLRKVRRRCLEEPEDTVRTSNRSWNVNLLFPSLEGLK